MKKVFFNRIFISILLMKIRNLSRQYEKIKIILETFFKIRMSKESEKNNNALL